MRRVKVILVVVLAAVGAVFIAQNSEVVAVRFLAWELSMSGIILLSGAMLIGFVVGFLLAKMPKRA